MFWVFQEWFVYKTLLQEPWVLVSLELAVLLIGSLAEGTVIGLLVPPPKKGASRVAVPVSDVTAGWDT